MAARDAVLAKAIAQAIKDVDDKIILFGLSGSFLIKQANVLGLSAWNEVFADRTYQDDGSLTPRSHAKSLIENAGEAVLHVKQILTGKKLTAISGKQIPVVADTVCLHGDGKNAVGIAKALYETFYKT
jgi:5-oxoprolinase (ATP-hydrolysing) subunit A